MSPEQSGSSSADIDTRSDVYSLGVVSLRVAGRVLPFDLKNIGSVNRCIVCMNRTHRTPSTRLRTLGEDTPHGAKPKHGNPALTRHCGRLGRHPRSRPLENDRRRRYRTPSAWLRTSATTWVVCRYLPEWPSFGYRAKKIHPPVSLGEGRWRGAIALERSPKPIQLRIFGSSGERADRITDFMTNNVQGIGPSESRATRSLPRDLYRQVR